MNAPVREGQLQVVKRSHLWERDELDWYVEPERATETLLSVERFVGPVWDPACGSGNIMRVFGRSGTTCAGSDIVRRIPDDLSHLFASEFDFLTACTDPPNLPFPTWHATNIVTNPPFFRAKGAEAFIRKALSIAAGKVCAFVDIRFIAGAERANGLFAEHPPHRIWIVTPRVSCPPGSYLAAGNKAGNGSSDWCWLVWDRTAPPQQTSIGWLRRAA